MTDAVYLSFVAGAALAGGFLLAGLGLGLRRLFTSREPGWNDLLLAPWTGWGVALAALQAVHLFAPIQPWCTLALAGLGLGGWCFAVKGSLRLLRAERAWRVAAGLVTVAVLAAWTAYHTAIGHELYDTGYYHLQAVRWARTFGVVPGLANLVKMLGFNCSHFLYVAACNVGPFVDRSHHIAGAVLLLAALVRCVVALRRVASLAAVPTAADTLEAILLVPVMGLVALTGFGASLSPDLPVYLVGFIAGAHLLRLLERDAGDAVAAWEAVALLWLGAVALTVKLSSLAFVGLTLGALATVPARAALGRTLRAPRVAVPLLAALAVLLVPWAIRGLVLSGWLLYPSTVLGWATDWQVPRADAVDYAREIRAWARLPYAPKEVVLADFAWVRPCALVLSRNALWVVAPLALAAGVAAAALVRPVRCAFWVSRAPWRFLGLPVGCLTFWWVAAPDHRFAGAAFWLLGAGAIALAVQAGDGVVRRAVPLSILVALFGMAVSPIDLVHRFGRDTGVSPAGAVVPRRTASGLQVWVPRDGHQVWNAALPATPHFRADLAARQAGRLSAGFRIDPIAPAEPAPESGDAGARGNEKASP